MQVNHLRTIGSAKKLPAAANAIAPKAPAGHEPAFEINRRPHDEVIAALEVSPAFKAEVAKQQFQIVKLANGREVMMPMSGDDAFGEYVRRVAKTCSFPSQKDAITRLGKIGHAQSLAPERDPRPVVGIMISEPRHLLGEGSYSSDALIQHMERMGLRPVLIPPRLDVMFEQDKMKRWAGIKAMISRLDGFAGPGGADVHPRIYGQLNRHSLKTNYPRDRFEADCAIVAMRSELYMLGICRSHQLWNAATGGVNIQDVRKDGWASRSLNQDHDDIPMDEPHVVRDAQGNIVHENRVYIDPNSSLGEAAGGAESIVTNSFHHQAVERPGRDFRPTAVVRDKKLGTATIEATEGPNAITTQWHPEVAKASAKAERALIDLFGRRVHVFNMLRVLRKSASEPTLDLLLARMKARSELPFSAGDYEWVRREVSPRVAKQAL